MLWCAEVVHCCGTADGESEAAPGARRWLARNAAAVRTLETYSRHMTAAACTSLVTCLPALENVYLEFSRPMAAGGLGRLLEALACCPRLESLTLSMEHEEGFDWWDRGWMQHSLAPIAQLRSLTDLSLSFADGAFYPLADVVRALVPLTGLHHLHVYLSQPAVVPAALGHLKAMEYLCFESFESFESCVLEAVCFNLPNLQTLDFCECCVEDAEVLASVPALPSLTSIAFSGGLGPPFVAQLLKLPLLQHMIFETQEPCVADYSDAYLGLPRLPADMSPLLLHLSLAGHGLTQFPLVLTQLVALEHLDARGNEFAELPIAITALSRLTELILGRVVPKSGPWQLHSEGSLNVYALGDLSAFPALCKLSFHDCSVTLSATMLGVTRHASFMKLNFCRASFPLECALMVQQLSQALERLGRGSVLNLEATVDGGDCEYIC